MRAVNFACALADELSDFSHVRGHRDSYTSVGIFTWLDDPGVPCAAELLPDLADFFVVHLWVVVGVFLFNFLGGRLAPLRLSWLLLLFQIRLDFSLL